ncbi:MAG: right-handed parallel beta-helix repeat-containing protein, partial [Candidatus Thorarchaeota archaeon]
MRRNPILIVIALALILIVTTPDAHQNEGLGFERNPVKENMYLSNEVHDYIQIWNNSHFIERAENESWDGDGSESTPYIIDAYNISSDYIGIEIWDVSLYFVIRDCYLDSVTGISNPGILLYNVSHGEIRSTTVTDKTVGIGIDSNSSVCIEGCTVSGFTSCGVFIYQSESCEIDGCEIYGGVHGIETRYSDYLTISNTEVRDCSDIGIYITESYFVTVTGGRTHDNGGAGIAFSGTHNSTISWHEAYNNSEGRTGVHLYYSDNATIINNELHDNIYAGLRLEFSHYAQIQGNLMWNNSDIGIYLRSSNNCSIVSNDLWSNGFWYFSFPPSGIMIDGSLYTVIEGNGICNNSFAGIYLTNQADMNEIIGNSIYNNTDHGIYAYDAHYIDVIGNDIWGNGWRYVPRCGIYSYLCSNWSIEGNRIWNNTMNGIEIRNSAFGKTLILENEISDNNGNGIWLYGGSQDYVVDSNIVHHNKEYGIHVQLYRQANVTNNIVYDNSMGVDFSSSAPSWIYGNDIGWNLMENAADSTGVGNNYWHDNVSIGNWWSDYSGMGDYIITAYGPPGAYDIFPKKSLDLNASMPIAYEISETDNTMFWEAYALNPSHFEVYTDDTLLHTEEWDGNDIEAKLDGLPAGTNDIMVIAYHLSGHSTNETAIAEVTDLTAPEWTMTPTDQEITQGEPFSYQLGAEDPSGIAGFALNDTTNFQIDSSGLLTN